MEESGKARLVKWIAPGYAKETIFRELKIVSFRSASNPLGLCDHIGQSGFYVDVADDRSLSEPAFRRTSVAEMPEADAVGS
mgnify:CR=1 FL=1